MLFMAFAQEPFMQAPNQQPAQGLDKLIKLLQGPPFNSEEGRSILIRLMADPRIKLSTEEMKSYADVQADLLDKDIKVRQIIAMAISLVLLSGNDIGKAIASRMREALGENATSLQLSFSKLDQLDTNLWHAFCSALQASNITSLYLFANNLNQLDADRWQAFYSALQASKVISLDLGANQLWQLTANQWRAFFTALQTSNVSSLSLENNNLGKLDAAQWQAFYSGLQASKITSLNLGSNALGKLNAGQWQAFCSSLQASKITSLDLSGNDLDELDADQWQTFCSALQTSKITSLRLNLNSLGKLHAARWQTLVTAMNDNFHLEIVGLPDNAPPELKVLCERNRLIRKAIKTADQLINQKPKSNEKDFLSQLDKTMSELFQGLFLIRDKKTSNAKERRSQIQEHLDELLWKKGTWLNNQLLTTQDKPINELAIKNQVRDTWMAISPQSKHYEQTHNDLFQLAYSDVLSDSNAHSAFMDALPFLLNNDRTLIKLNDHNQKVFDAYLFTAAGGIEGGLEKKYTPEERVALLQYVVLLNIKEIFQKNATIPQTQFFTTERYEGLKDSLKNLSFDANQLNEEARTKIQTLWADTCNRLKVAPLHENTPIFVAAITHLASSIKQQSDPSYGSA
jgi:hypothetical protein